VTARQNAAPDKHTPAPGDPGMPTYATLRDGEDETHLECRFSDGQKYAAVTVDVDCETLAGFVLYAINHATLMAAAPDLLAALKVLMDHASETYPHFEDTRGQAGIAAARAAIAKAAPEVIS
jgi:hypothetical protein